MENNLKDFPLDFVEPFIPAFNEFHRAGVNIFQNNNSKWTETVRGFFIAMCITILYVTMNVYFSGVFVGRIDIFELCYIVPFFLVFQIAIVKGIVTMMKKSDITNMILELGSMWRSENLTEEQVNKKNVLLKRLNLFHKIYLWSYWPGIYLYVSASLIEVLYQKFVLQRESDLLLPFACTFPFDPRQNWVVYILTYIFEMYSMVKFMGMYTSYDTLFTTLCSHLCTEFMFLQEDLLNMETVVNNIQEADDYDYDLTQAPPNIKVVIKRHNKLIEMSKKLDEICNVMIFVNLFVVSIMVGFLGLACEILSRPLDLSRNAAGIPCALLPVFYFCYYGELLSGASAEIGDCAFNTLWYNGHVRYKQAVLFIILRSQKVCQLTILGYAPISLKMFTRVLSTTWSYFSLVTSMYEREE